MCNKKISMRGSDNRSQRRLANCGGNWNNTSNAGLGYRNGNNPRTNVNNNIGFRVARLKRFILYILTDAGNRYKDAFPCRCD